LAVSPSLLLLLLLPLLLLLLLLLEGGARQPTLEAWACALLCAAQQKRRGRPYRALSKQPGKTLMNL